MKAINLQINVFLKCGPEVAWKFKRLIFFLGLKSFWKIFFLEFWVSPEWMLVDWENRYFHQEYFLEYCLYQGEVFLQFWVMNCKGDTYMFMCLSSLVFWRVCCMNSETYLLFTLVSLTPETMPGGQHSVNKHQWMNACTNRTN